MTLKLVLVCCRPKVPNYVVSLDLPPTERWQQIGNERSTQVIFSYTVDVQIYQRV